MNTFYRILFAGLLSVPLHSQNIPELLQRMPPLFLQSREAFKDAILNLEKLQTDDGVEITRVKSWDYGKSISQWQTRLEKIQAEIDKKTESGSFSLENYSATDKESEIKVESLAKTESQITSAWNHYHQQITAINPDFFPLNENEYGCDEIRKSSQDLERHAGSIQQLLLDAKIEIIPLSEVFQNQYAEIKAINNSFLHNQADGHMSTLLNMLNQMTNHINASYKNMVDTEMVFVNAQCKL